jgi:putative membrane protein
MGAYGPYGMFGYGGGWHEWGPMMMMFGGLFWIVLLIVGIAAVVWLVRGSAHGAHRYPSRIDRVSSGIDVLDERYARGDLNREEYLQRKKDILQRGA